MPPEPSVAGVQVGALAVTRLRPVDRVMSIDRSAVTGLLHRLHATQTEAAAGDGPPLDAMPYSCDQYWSSNDGNGRHFVPAAEIATRAPTSAVPAVFVDRVSGGWSLRVVLNLRRHPHLPELEASPLEVGDLEVRLYCPSDGAEDSLPLTDITELPPAGPGVLRRLLCRAPLTRTFIDLMRTVPGTVLLVTAVPRFGWSPLLRQ